MSAIVGVYCLDGNANARVKVNAMLVALAHRGPDGRAAWSAGQVGFGHLALDSMVSPDRVVQPLVVADGNLVITADARIDNRAELTARFGAGAEGASDASLIARAYRRWGATCAEHLLGDFAFAIWDRRAKTVFCARDPMGVKPLYYFHSERMFAFATEIKALFALTEVPRTLDDEALALWMVVNEEDRARTLYRHVHRLEAASTMQVTPEWRRVRRYWDPTSVAPVQLASEAEYVEAFRELFTESVRARLRADGPVGATLSGGLDSSSIVCTARRLLPADTPLHTFSLIFPEIGERERYAIDEREYMDHVIRGGGLSPHFVRGEDLSPLGDVNRMLWHADEPFYAPNLYLHWGMFKAAAASGVRVFLDGFDGDSAVSHGLARLNNLLRGGDWAMYEAEVRACAERHHLQPSKVVEQFGIPYLAELARRGRWVRWGRTAADMHDRFRFSRAELVRGAALECVPEVVQRAWKRMRQSDTGELLRPAVADRVRGRLRATARRGRRSAAVGERQAHIAGITQPLYQLTLELADKSAAAFGLEPRYPFFDRRLIEFCIGVPDSFKFAQGWTRLLLRNAMEGILPPEIQWRSNKANLSANFHAQLRGADRAIVEGAAFDHMGEVASVAVLDAARQRYFAAKETGQREADGLLVFRSAVLSIWLAQGRAERGSSSDRAMRSLPMLSGGHSWQKSDNGSHR